MGHLIVGHVTPSSARIWVRGDGGSKEARLRFREAKATPGPWTTEVVPLVAHRGFVETIELTGLSPATRYECELSYKAGPAPPVKAATFATSALAGPFRFLLGSCNWSRGGLIRIGDAKASWEGVRALVAAASPDFMIHCGDQVYADIITGPLPQFMHLPYFRGLHQTAWKVKPTAEVLASLPNYMILDDHEIFDDFYNGKPYLGQPSQTICDFAKQAYQEYQHSRNPQDFSPGFYYSFQRSDAHFFALDVRTERHKGDNATMVGEEQLQTFLQWLLEHRDEVKFVLTSVPFLAEVRSGDDKWCSRSFRFQRDAILDFVSANGIGRLVFLTGDMHCSAHTTMTLGRGPGAVVLHELMSSPINQVAVKTSHQFVLALTGTTTSGKVDFDVELKPEEFYGEHSSVMLVDVEPSGQISWQIHRTKTGGAPPAPVLGPLVIEV
jgi:alkaline phosphatase D